MRRSSNLLFGLFLIASLGFIFSSAIFRSSVFFLDFNDVVISLVSGVLVIIIILAFICRERENNKIQNEFITIVTHKFRTPLTGIHWTIDMLQKDITLLEKKDLLMEMEKANERLLEIVDLMVGFAKFDKRLEYAFEAVSLREIVGFSLNKYSAATRNKNIKFVIESDRELPLIIIDKAKIQFVVDMLIDNALKYTPKEGNINISFDIDKKNVTLKIKDSGIGFDFFDGLRIFRHFFRSKKAKLMDTDGLGLGLYTAKKIVTHHGGRLWAQSPGPGKGSTFFLSLPIKK
jgi:two-component system phosphate regulon sensor histidine kinase PhoR